MDNLIGSFTNTNKKLFNIHFLKDNKFVIESPLLKIEGFYETKHEDNRDVLILEFDDQSIRAEYYLFNGLLALKYLKSPPIQNHVDEIIYLYKNDKLEVLWTNCSSIKINSLKKGDYYINFRKDLNFINKDCAELEFHDNMIIDYNEDFNILFLDSIVIFDRSNKKIPICTNNVQENCIEILGFNQIPRDRLKEIINHENLENVLFLSYK